MDITRIREKVYVAIGNQVQEDEGFLTLDWVIKRWALHHPISIVIFYINSSTSKEFIYTPFGKLPASSISDEKLRVLRKCEQEKIDKLLSKYVLFCGKVKVEAHKIKTLDEPIQETVIKLITQHRVTKLVMDMTLMRASSGRSNSVINGSFYVQRNKPEFCELHNLCRGKLMILKEENEGEGHMEDEQGVTVARWKPRASLKGWLGKMLLSSNGHGKTEIFSSSSSSSRTSMSNNGSESPRNQWEKYQQEIDEYFQELVVLLGSKSNVGEVMKNGEENRFGMNSPSEQDIPDYIQDVNDRVQALRTEIQVACKMVDLSKNQTKDEVNRQSKASWAICLCNHRAEELEAQLSAEIATRHELTTEIDSTREQLYEILADVQESKSRLNSLLELQSEISAKLQVSSLAKLGAEAQLENAVKARAELVTEIEELRRQRDVFRRRIEFCKEKDAIEMAMRMTEKVSCSYKEFSSDEIRVATDGFSPHRRLKSNGNWTNVYKGKVNRLSVAVKMLDSDVSDDFFQAKGNLLGNIRHPHISALIGFCTEIKCFVFEYMHNGCLRDILFSRRKGRTLQWHHRIHIVAQVSSALDFLHQANPTPIIHNALNPSNVLLDRNFVAKIHPFELTPCDDENGVLADVFAFGDFLLLLLTGRNWAGLDQAMGNDKGVILAALDDNAGDWPVGLANEVAQLAINCRSLNIVESNATLAMSRVAEELDNLKIKADDLNARREHNLGSEEGSRLEEDTNHVPTCFICPIFQVVMENPHIAADGFSYEFEAIEEWLKMGHETSPATNLKLNHKRLVPNRTLRSLIQDWHSTV